MPSGSTLDTAFSFLTTNRGLDFSIINTGSTVSLTMGSGVTLVGKTTIGLNGSVLYRLVKTGTATYTMYQIAGN